jgi:hypothetical protein
MYFVTIGLEPHGSSMCYLIELLHARPGELRYPLQLLKTMKVRSSGIVTYHYPAMTEPLLS